MRIGRRSLTAIPIRSISKAIVPAITAIMSLNQPSTVSREFLIILIGNVVKVVENRFFPRLFTIGIFLYRGSYTQKPVFNYFNYNLRQKGLYFNPFKITPLSPSSPCPASYRRPRLTLSIPKVQKIIFQHKSDDLTNVTFDCFSIQIR